MKFKIVSHACLLVEHNGKRLLTDPWIIGSCYWRSWWHFPKAIPFNDELLSVDYIYLTHEHFDHFHYPSMRKFRKDIAVLIPQFPIPSMEDALTRLGFTNVISLWHGDTMSFSDSFVLTSYQAGWTNDSALVVKCGNHSLLNLNDAKFEDSVFESIIKKHGPIDFMFRSHSSAQAYPECYSSENPDDIRLRTNEDYIEDFITALKRSRARWGIPFASNVCFLHEETLNKNTNVVHPLKVLNAYKEDAVCGREVVVMLPGAQWDSQTGFDLVATDALEDKPNAIRQLLTKHSEMLQRQNDTEKALSIEFETFQFYMGKFLQSLPWLLTILYKAKIVYAIQKEDHDQWWVLDFKTRRVSRDFKCPTDAVSIIYVAPGLLQDAMQKGIVNFIDISKRLHIMLRSGCVLQHFVFKELITLYEMGNFPLWKNLNRRFLQVWWARRQEVRSYIGKAFRGAKSFIPRVERQAK